MKKKLLITDSFFVTEEHVHQLEAAGYDVSRLDKVEAPEAELIAALQGVSVYILGGVEKVTDTVIEAAPDLEAIIFTGVDYNNFIPGAELAQSKGIKLLNAPGANAIAVAEFAVGVALLMLRQLFGVSRLGDKKFITAESIQGSTVGLIGAGYIGQTIGRVLEPFQPQEIVYFNRSDKDITARKVELAELAQTADVIFISLPKSAGCILSKEIIDMLKPGCLIVSISPMNLIDFGALLPRLQRGEVRCAVDEPVSSEEYNNLPPETWFHVNSHSGFNTRQAINAASDSVTATAISLL